MPKNRRRYLPEKPWVIVSPATRMENLEGKNYSVKGRIGLLETLPLFRRNPVNLVTLSGVYGLNETRWMFA